MSGYRAAPAKVEVSVPSGANGRTTLWRTHHEGEWFDQNGSECASECAYALDALYWSRIDALDSAAAACEAIGDARGAEAVRRLKETT